MGFEALPDEILFEIVELVSIPRKNYPGHPNQKCLGTQDLLSVLRCCHRFYRIGEPILYRTFIQTTHKVFPGFIRTLLSRPGLSHHVRCLHLTQNDLDTSDETGPAFTEGLLAKMHYQLVLRTLDDQIQIHLNNEEGMGKNRSLDNNISSGLEILEPQQTLASAQALISRPTTPETPQLSFSTSQTSEDAEELLILIRRGGHGGWRALVTYIIYCLPNIESISIDIVKIGSTPIDPLFHRTISAEAITIPKLREISISYTKRHSGFGFDTFLSLLKHPSLRSFTADNIREFGWFPTPRNLELPLTSLKLSRSNLSASSIDAILKCCPNLEYLKYEHDQGWSEQPFMPQLFGYSIKHLKESLKELVLYKAEAYNAPRLPQPEEFRTLGVVLVQFRNLKSLSITANLLVGPQRSEGSHWWRISAEHVCSRKSLLRCLPASLEKLRLKECGDEIVKDVLALVEQSAIILPRLKELVLGFVDLQHNKYTGGFRERVVRREVVHRSLNMDEIDRLEEDCGRKEIVLEVQFS